MQSLDLFFYLSIINILLFPFSPDNRRKQQSGKTMWRWTGWRRTAFSSCIPKESSAAEPRSVAYGARHLLAATSLACESRDLRNRRDNRWVQFNKLKAETRVDLIIHIVTETVWKLNKMNEISRTVWLGISGKFPFLCRLNFNKKFWDKFNEEAPHSRHFNFPNENS